MRNAPPRIPFEKLAFSQPIKARNKQLTLAQKIGKEEDDYLNDLNQFYLDYHNYEQKRLYVLQLKKIQSILNQEKITKSTFSSVFLDQLDQRKNNALQILNEKIIDNSELEKEVIALESKVMKYQIALKQRSSVKYLYGDLYPKQTLNLIMPEHSKKLCNFDTNINCFQAINGSLDNTCNKRQEDNNFKSLESQVIEMQMQNEEKQMELRRKNILLNQQMRSIDNSLFQVQKSLQLYKTERYFSKSTHYSHQKCDEELFDIKEAILNKRKMYIQEKEIEISKLEEKIETDEKQNQSEYDKLENTFCCLKEKIDISKKLKKELLQLKKEISINKCILFNKKNEYYDFNRQLSAQKEEIHRINEQKNKIHDNIFNMEALLAQKEEELNQKRKYFEQLHQKRINIENELLTIQKIMELKQKNLHFIQNQIDSQINGEKVFRKPIKRLLQLENLGLKKTKAFPNKPLSIKRDENVISNQF